MNRGLLLLIYLIFGMVPSADSAWRQQPGVAQLIKEAEASKKAFKDEEALSKYLEALKIDPNHLAALCAVSELYNVLGKRLEDKKEQKNYFSKGRDYAARALKVNPNSSEANFAMAVSMGRMALLYSGEEKVKAVKEIKVYADRCIQLDPQNFKGYHVLGKWHYEISNLSGVERLLVKTFFGGFPQSSFAEAARNYEKSMELNPSFLLNYLELAKVCKEMGEKSRARQLINQMLKMPALTADDPKIKAHGRKLLNDL